MATEPREFYDERYRAPMIGVGIGDLEGMETAPVREQSVGDAYQIREDSKRSV